MAYGNDKVDFYVTDRYITSSGCEAYAHFIHHEGPKTWQVFSSAKSTATVADTSAAGSTHTPDGASGWGTLVGTRYSRNRAVALARKTVQALHIGWLSP